MNIGYCTVKRTQAKASRWSGISQSLPTGSGEVNSDRDSDDKDNTGIAVSNMDKIWYINYWNFLIKSIRKRTHWEDAEKMKAGKWRDGDEDVFTIEGPNIVWFGKERGRS